MVALCGRYSTRNVIFYNPILSYRVSILSYRACFLLYRACILFYRALILSGLSFILSFFNFAGFLWANNFNFKLKVVLYAANDYLSNNNAQLDLARNQITNIELYVANYFILMIFQK